MDNSPRSRLRLQYCAPLTSGCISGIFLSTDEQNSYVHYVRSRWACFDQCFHTLEEMIGIIVRQILAGVQAECACSRDRVFVGDCTRGVRGAIDTVSTSAEYGDGAECFEHHCGGEHELLVPSSQTFSD